MSALDQALALALRLIPGRFIRMGTYDEQLRRIGE